MIAVMEPNGTSREPSMETDYIYDGLNNLLQAKQNGINGVGTPRTRTFVYDSLSRLQTSTNPETGTISYSYDANGNVHTKTDARGVVATYAYDNLNRLLSKSYTYDASGTPMSCYQYDLPSVTNGIGRLTSAWTQLASVASSCSTSAAFVTMRSILAYDPMGHLVSEQQYTPASMASGMTYAPKYTYDLAGNLTSSTDGVTPVPTQNTLSAPCLDTPVSSNMLTLVTCPDAGGHLQMVMSNWIDNTHPTWLLSAPPNAFQPSYAAFGGLMNATFGNAALTLNRTYDNRLRMTGEFDMGAAVPTATSSSATVSITGAEQSQ
jgi:YD repeat-containing protein